MTHAIRGAPAETLRQAPKALAGLSFRMARTPDLATNLTSAPGFPAIRLDHGNPPGDRSLKPWSERIDIRAP